MVPFILQNDNLVSIICSNSTNPWYNLALEEYLLYNLNDNEIILFLWQNDNTIVIGRNQNAFTECRYKKFLDDKGKIARRLSGGGAVYHDLGNLNFTFLMDRHLYNLDKQLNVIIQAIKKYEINAKFSGRNDLTIDGKKFSGNAFYFLDKTCYHHGTLLINTDFQRLTYYLEVKEDKIQSKGINSVKSRVINLSTLNKDITIENMKTSLIDSFKDNYKSTHYMFNKQIDSNKLKSLYNKYASWEWQFGESPNFDISIYRRFLWGDIQLNLSLTNSYIDKVKIYSDAMDSHLIHSITTSLIHCPFRINDIINCIKNASSNKSDESIIQDISLWIAKEFNYSY